jgi:rubrerythrin
MPMAELIDKHAGPDPVPAFHCARCGHGARGRIAPERCPICGGGTWEYVEQRSTADRDLPARKAVPRNPT